MASTEIGLYDLGEDRTVRAVEERVAEMTAKEAGFFAITGRVANLVALMSLAGNARPLVRESRSHLASNEAVGLARIAHLTTYDVDGDSFGCPDADQLTDVVREASARHGQECVVALENTHNVAGGCAMSPEKTCELALAARAAGAVSIYMDGARLWNASVALSVPLDDLLAPVDSAMLSVSKGLGAPFGAVVVGTGDLITAVRRHAEFFGALSVHRMGYLASAALVALENWAGRLEQDHRRARELGAGLASIDGLAVDLRTVQTNLVRIDVTHPALDAKSFVTGLRTYGIGAMIVEVPDGVRFAVNPEIKDEDIRAAIHAARLVVSGAGSLSSCEPRESEATLDYRSRADEDRVR